MKVDVWLGRRDFLTGREGETMSEADANHVTSRTSRQSH
jgi:hypothetical protein